MFSPMGKKKLLLQQKFGGTSAQPGSPPSLSPPRPSTSTVGSAITSRDDRDLKELKKKLKIQAPTSTVAASGRLEVALSDVGHLGDAMRRIMEATARYRPERDGILLKAFESRTIDYEFFRLNLRNVFWLSFSDDEFKALIEYFDPTSAELIDGYSFMKAFVRLSGIRKTRDSLEVREKQEVFEQSQKDDAEREQLAKEKKLEKGIDFGFNAAARLRAIEKLHAAAKRFDPGHPSAPSTRSFNINFVKPATFR
jgi:hypothetical protein